MPVWSRSPDSCLIGAPSSGRRLVADVTPVEASAAALSLFQLSFGFTRVSWTPGRPHLLSTQEFKGESEKQVTELPELSPPPR